MTVGRSKKRLAGAVVAALLAAGCIQTTTDVPEVFREPDLPVEAPSGPAWWDCATFRLAREGKVRIVLFRTLGQSPGAAPPRLDENTGAASPPAPPSMPAAFEYLYFELPERPRAGWARQDDLPAWRWVRLRQADGRPYDRVWRGEEGKATLRFGVLKESLRADLRVVMRPVGGDGMAHMLGGTVVLAEDVVRTQGYANAYNPKLEALLARGASK